jgi:hypothetical protein
MEENVKSEELIDKLIKKRKEENDAFLKLLQAMNSKTGPLDNKSKISKKDNRNEKQ